MRSIPFFSTVLVAALLLTMTPAAAGLTMTGGTLAQTAANETETGPTVDVDTGIQVDNQTYAQQIDPTLRLVEWEYSDGAFQLVFEADRSATITITEAVQFEEGAGSGRIYSTRVPKGTTEVTVPVKLRAGQAAVTMVTARSMERNSYSYVSTGQTDPDRPPIDYGTAQFLVVATGIGAAGATFRLVRRRREDDNKESDKIL